MLSKLFPTTLADNLVRPKTCSSTGLERPAARPVQWPCKGAVKTRGGTPASLPDARAAVVAEVRADEAVELHRVARAPEAVELRDVPAPAEVKNAKATGPCRFTF